MRASSVLLLLPPLLAACGQAEAEVEPEQQPGRVEVIGAPFGQPPPLDAEPPAPPAPLEIEVEPGELHEISFAHLSLLGTDVDGLIDLMFAPNPTEVAFEFPPSVKALDGERVSIVGYQIPLEWDESDPGNPRVTRFMLVRDLATCCFGGIPRPDEWTDVTASEPAQYWMYRPIRVTGTLSVGLERQEDALMTSVFQIKGASAALER